MKKLILTALTVLILSTGIVAPAAAASGDAAPQPTVFTTEEPTPDEAKKIFIGGLSATGDSEAGDSVATGRDDVITREDKDRG